MSYASTGDSVSSRLGDCNGIMPPYSCVKIFPTEFPYPTKLTLNCDKDFISEFFPEIVINSNIC